MWDKLKSISQHPAAKAVKKFCGDPVQLYSVFLVMTAMYYYHKQYAWLYTILTLAVSFVLMRFYDFVAKKRLIGPVCYLIFLALGLYSVSLLTHLGEQSYPLTFFVWFLTPQGVVDFSLIYTIAIYLLMTGFITSAVYYFAQVRYRMVMQFIIMMIPLSLYAKEGLQMPALLVILLLSSFFLLMVYCRQLRENDAVRLMDGFHSGVSIALFVAAFSVTAAIIPKPQFQADREFIDNAMSYSTLSDTLMKAISMFTESTNNTGTVSNNARTIGYADSREMLRLRTQTYSYYSGSNDSWNVISQYDKPDREYSEPLTYQPRVLTQAILDAAAADADFAAKYDLTDLIGLELPPQDLYTLSLYTLTPVLPIPTRTTGIRSGLVENIFRSDSGAITGDIRSTGISVDYYSDMYVLYDAEAEVLNRLDHESYPELLYDAEQILLDSDPEAAELLGEALGEQLKASIYLETTDAQDYHSEIIDDLAADITAGLHSDLEKALAIERYFTDQGYLYDLSYKKQPGDNIDTFLSSSHVGVCYEYATAMVLLCRRAGLPARLATGFNLCEPYEAQVHADGKRVRTNYVLKVRDSHAFPEVYISGYGWVSFEPTVADDSAGRSKAENLNVARWGYVLLALTLISIGIWAILPYVREKQFRRRLPGMGSAEAASAMFLRMRTVLHLEDSTTVLELEQNSRPFFSEDSVFAEIDRLLYDPAHRSSMNSQQLAEAYIRWQAQHKVYEKEVKRLRKEQKKHHVNA